MDPGRIIPQAEEVYRLADSIDWEELRSAAEQFTAYSMSFGYILNARFFRTRKGYMGTGSLPLMEGDSIWLVPGAAALLVLRKTSITNRFELVGNAYVHGLMHGEACERGGMKLEPFELA